MTIETLTDRIAKAETKIEKKLNTISKKTAQIEKKKAALVKKYGINPDTFDRYDKAAREAFGREGDTDIYWTLCDISSLQEDIKRGNKEIKETEKKLAEYREQLLVEDGKELEFLKIPESMKLMQTELVDSWDKYDIEYRDRMRAEHKELGYIEFYKRHPKFDRDLFFRTNEQIHKENARSAKAMVWNLYNRVREVTGEVTEWKYLTCTIGNEGPVLNGIVIGEKGKANVDTILAGGYNIQKLHARTLVHII